MKKYSFTFVYNIYIKGNLYKGKHPVSASRAAQASEARLFLNKRIYAKYIGSSNIPLSKNKYFLTYF